MDFRVLLGIIAVAWPVDVLRKNHKLGLRSLDSGAYFSWAMQHVIS